MRNVLYYNAGGAVGHYIEGKSGENRRVLFLKISKHLFLFTCLRTKERERERSQ